jgi:hypothetical protein
MAHQSVARGGPAKRGSAAKGMPARGKVYMGRLQPTVGSHLLRKRLLSLFASSPFAHSIPQSRRRASGDLFSSSQGPNIKEGIFPLIPES